MAEPAGVELLIARRWLGVRMTALLQEILLKYVILLTVK